MSCGCIRFGKDNNTFDTVISIRCLINAGNLNEMKKALFQIYNSLKTGGRYLMCENFISGLNEINEARKSVSLDPIKTRWHNTYIPDKEFSIIQNNLQTIEINHFLSSYFFVSELLTAGFQKENLENPIMKTL